MASKPIVGIITNEIINFNGRQISHSTGKRYVKSVMEFANVVPVLIPSSIPIDGSSGVVGIFWTVYLLSIKNRKSVNVPPTSTPTALSIIEAIMFLNLTLVKYAKKPDVALD